jgi:D-beta-D-heptose 7-phosphate kinase / D-beta-D-heptose 1-phosphate adenosyltransferase
VSDPLVVVGDLLLDRDLDGTARRLSPDAPVPVVDQPTERARAGGAGLAATLAARDGRDVILVAAVSDDAAGATARSLLAESGVTLVAIPRSGGTPEKVRIRADGHPLARVDRGGDGEPEHLPDEARDAVRSAAAVLVSDYGYGTAALPALRGLLGAASRTPVVWDPHPRGPVPVKGVRLATPNDAEARHFTGAGNGAGDLAAVNARARRLVADWQASAVAITLGRRGALLSTGDGTPLVAPAPAVTCTDPCGAGDRFAASAAGLLADGALPSEAVHGAVVAAAAFVAAGGASAALPSPSPANPAVGGDIVAAVRQRGGTVVATGGCFDLLHAGHVASLEAARSLGDCLVVCLNSDASIRRLKGPSRPAVPQEDRQRVLSALSCVDAVVVFDEDTPERLLAELRPDIWAKGGDYAERALPESRLVASWGGQAVVLPYLDGRSTTRLLQHTHTSKGSL